MRVVLSEIEEGEDSSTTDHERIDSNTFKTAGSTRSRASLALTIDASLVPALTHLAEPDETRGRQTPLFCGSCCDVRKACLAIDGTYFFFMLWTIPIYAFTDINFKIMSGSFVDRLYSDEVYRYAALTQQAFGFVFCINGFVGALRFQKHMVLATGIYYVIDAIVYLVFLNWLSTLAMVMYLYPHFAMYWAMRKGTMKRKNYEDRESYCCCCPDRDDDDDSEEEYNESDEES